MISVELLIPQKWFTYQCLQKRTRNINKLFKLFKQLLLKKLKTNGETFFFIFSDRLHCSRADSKIKNPFLGFFLFYRPPDSSKKAWGWNEYQKINCPSPKGDCCSLLHSANKWTHGRTDNCIIFSASRSIMNCLISYDPNFKVMLLYRLIIHFLYLQYLDGFP